ncbi:MAG: AmmeMemoRadiSam system protein B [Candidatus Obscuribacter sp.]|nr:AmmeMemoRadiSam system protein B [Candidatus Obscuribacter sp.]MBP6595278.1 AmmeMemoRadiSam system protein B [Candidatus Obscuribacter sp.]
MIILSIPERSIEMPVRLMWSIVLVAVLALYFLLSVVWQSFALTDVRYPSFAGSWYPGNRQYLEHLISTCYVQANASGTNSSHCNKLSPEQSHDEGQKRSLVALVAPHAAFRYSGQAQAYCYQLLKQQNPKRIFILAAGHSRVMSSGAILPAARSFNTPLGNVELDRDCINRLMQLPFFSVNATTHKLEHSVELQLPYIAYSLPQTKIVPLIIGKIDSPEMLPSLASSIKSVIEPGDIILVSTDFTHFGRYYNYVPFDQDISANILKLDREAYSYLKARDLNGFIQFKKRTGDTICGYTACLLLLALLPEDSQARVLDYYTSNDMMGTKVKSARDKSISYMSLAFFH